MKIFLINPSCAAEEGRDLYTTDVAGALFTMQPLKKVTLGMPLALPTLAAHTPSHHEVKIIDEEIEEIDFDESVDLVGITAMSFKAKRAYEISFEFKKRGITVVLGGIHASMCPDEALQYVDSVVIGEAEDIWEAVISDTENGKLKKTYKADGFPNLERAKIPRYDLVKNKSYVYTYLQTTRGCPYNCKFCTVTKQNGRRIRKKLPEQVIKELDILLKLRPKKEFIFRDRKEGRCKKIVGNIAFIDDNFAIDRNHALAVCNALIKYQEDNDFIIAWYTQVNINIGLDEELLKAMAASNCFHVFVGIESIDPDILRKMNKQMNLPKRYAEAVGNIQKHGIRVIASTIIGEDGTTWESIKSLKSFLEENNILHVLVNILTPYPGTEIRDEFVKEERLLTRNPQKYNIRNVVFKPKGISKEQLEEMYVWLCRSVYDYSASYRRGKPLFKFDDRFSLPLYLRLPAVGGFLFTLIILILRGRIRLKPAAWSFYMIPYLMLFKGSFYAMELVTICLDYDDFAHREERRFMAESVTLGNEDNLLSISHQIAPVRSPSGKKYKTFYVDGIDLRNYGFSVPSENLHNPVLLLGGTSIPISDRKRLIKSFLEAGYEVASIENPIGGLFNFRIDPVKERPEALKDYLGHLQNSYGIKEINIVAQSYSAFELVRVMLEDPFQYKGFVRCIILVNPPGFDENLNMAKHIFRFLWKHVIRGYLNPKSMHPDKVGFRKKERVGILTWTGKTLTNIVRSLREVHDIVHYRIKTPLKELLGHGYKVCFFLQTDDQVVPARITLKHAEELVSQGQIRCVEGGHNDLFFQEWQRKSFIDFYKQMTLRQ
ncbi:MAG TPA: B12-binding domain-containing radical SAM protein [Candidatus Wujingus californicus]|uniref:B12-binding domain-containing radical SAM protein n=1 Tax=Candidatus Wujingus californicus TaxID=3367618 RepID=UPI001DFFDE6C|nr:B12-binding domain-containing radical SAM protein [Planctomycetota bacterium]